MAFKEVTSFLRRAEDYELITYCLMERLRLTTYWHAEVMFPSECVCGENRISTPYLKDWKRAGNVASGFWNFFALDF